MSSSESFSSWHPAFMPNETIANTVTSPPKDTHDSRSSWHPAFRPDALPVQDNGVLAAPSDATNLLVNEEIMYKTPSKEDEGTMPPERNEAGLLYNTIVPNDEGPRTAPSPGNAFTVSSKLNSFDAHGSKTIIDARDESKAEQFSLDSTSPPGHNSLDLFARSAQTINWGEEEMADIDWDVQKTGNHTPEPSNLPGDFSAFETVQQENEFPISNEQVALGVDTGKETTSLPSVDWMVEEEADTVDSEWNLQRHDSNAFKFMAATDRTNSFPAVPPLTYTEDVQQSHPLPQSQAEEIVAEIEEDKNELFNVKELNDEDDFFSQQASAGVPQEALYLQSETPDYGQSYGGESNDLDFEERYEEGVPLVEHHFNEQLRPETDPSSKEILFADEEHYKEDDFFTGMAPDSVLKRKSTMQVMDTLRFESDVAQMDEEDESYDSMRRNSVGGGIASSKSTILEQALGASESAAHLDSVDEERSSDDIAAQWAAALADDEFLDDEDGFLEDDEPTAVGTLDPAALFEDDNDGFLDDDDDFNAAFSIDTRTRSPEPVAAVTSNGQMVGFDSLTGSAFKQISQSTQNRYVPANAGITPSAAMISNAYAPAAPLFTNLMPQSGQSKVSSSYVTAPTTGPVNAAFGSQPQLPKSDVPKALSFADRAKGGYTSPYDLPMDVVVPKKRASMQQMAQNYGRGAHPPAAPPRSSSMQNSELPRPTRSSSSSVPPSLPTQEFPTTQQSAPFTHPTAPALKPSSSFFEELPVTTKPRPSGRYTPQPSASNVNIQGPGPGPGSTFGQSPPPIPQSQIPARDPLPAQALQPSPFPFQPPQTQHGLVAPPPVNPYASVVELQQPQMPSGATRYSPAPPGQQSGMTPPTVQGRYTAPPAPRQTNSTYSVAPGGPPINHQPRTSSPLAQFERSTHNRAYNGLTGATSNTVGLNRQASSQNDHGKSGLPIKNEARENLISLDTAPLSDKQTSNQQLRTPTSQNPDLSLSPSRRTTSSYAPTGITSERSFAPPQRSQTQSPSQMRTSISSSATDPYSRPVSVQGPRSPREMTSAFTPLAPIVPGKTRASGTTQRFNYVTPTDGRGHDPLQRWRGGPIFAWGIGGTVITSFPKEVPRYGIGQTAPVIICSPGELKLQTLKDVYPMETYLASFPGPLKGKSKKKEVITWLKTGIELLEEQNSYIRDLSHLAHEDKRKEERVLLWKMLLVMIENDGLLEGNPAVNKSVRDVMTPGIEIDDRESVPRYATGADLSGIHRRDGTSVQADPVDPATVDELRKHLLRGDREKAVWDAVDKRLWAHAMLISNTVSKELYKQVAQEFVQKEVKGIGENTESLAALYEIFAGNFEESIDELVPPSARAGFQMVSASGPVGPHRDATDGLDRWRETLGLVLSNRSPDDNQAILALGKLLSGYGRAEAAHICFMFARTHAVFGGLDDIKSNIVLLGSDHLRQPVDSDKELEPILLTEVFEYAMVLAGIPSMATGAPHLASYKFYHAIILAEAGQRDKALQYCETIANAITSQTRRSPYHHALLVSSLDDLSKRIKASPKEETASWMSKPSIDKVSTSVWSKFNKFVAGDEKEDDPSVLGDSEAGPFARIAGGTPSLSREPSSADLATYGSYPAPSSYPGAGPVPTGLGSRTPSRYAPGGSFIPAAHDSNAPSSYSSQPQPSYTSSLPGEVQPYGTVQPNLPSTHGRYAPNAQDRYAPGLQQTTSTYAPSYPATPVTEHIPSSSLYGSPQSVYNATTVPGIAESMAHNEPNQKPFHTQAYQPLDNEGFRSPESVASSYNPQHGLGDPPLMDSVPEERQDPLSYGYSPPAVYGGYEPTSHSNNSNQPPKVDGYQFPDASSGYQPYEANGSYDTPSNEGGFQPLEQNTGYVPYEESGSYQPPEDEPESPITTQTTRGPMYDEDIPAPKQAADVPALAPSREKTKAEKDKEADEAFRRAAEEDDKKAAAASASATAKKGWGWNPFGGGAKKKEEPAPAAANLPNKPIKAKLGEESSFVYDPELKRWVNKKAGAEDTAAKGAAAPPPRAGPSRTPSSGTGPPSAGLSGPPGRTPSTTMTPNMPGAGPAGTPPPPGPIAGALKMPPMSRAPSNGSLAGGPPSSVGSAPPSRPGTGMGTKSNDPMDDLLGAPMARKAGGVKGKKKPRQVIDVFGEKAGA